MDYITFFPAMATALGGYELVRFLLTRRSMSRQEAAKAEGEEFRSLREYNEFLQEQLKDYSRRSAEQTELVRSLNAEILSLTRAKAETDMQLALKLCEVRSCPNRKPQSGF